MGGPDEAPELYDLEKDPVEATNVWSHHEAQGATLFRDAIDFMRSLDASEKFLKPREESLRRFATTAASRGRD